MKNEINKQILTIYQNGKTNNGLMWKYKGITRYDTEL